MQHGKSVAYFKVSWTFDLHVTATILLLESSNLNKYMYSPFLKVI